MSTQFCRMFRYSYYKQFNMHFCFFNLFERSNNKSKLYIHFWYIFCYRHKEKNKQKQWSHILIATMNNTTKLHTHFFVDRGNEKNYAKFWIRVVSYRLWI